MEEKIRIGIIGTGDWGRNHVRTFASMDDCCVTRICDASDDALQKASAIVPSAKARHTSHKITGASDVDAVVIATSSDSHYELALHALLEGKHLLIEKPFVLQKKHAERLIELAENHHCVLMVGHLLLHHPVVKEMKKRIEAGELGTMYYLYSTRINFGKVRTNENALWSFAPHDISTMNYLTGRQPRVVQATGQAFINQNNHDVVFFSMRYDNQVFAQGQVSWLDPHKRRSMTIVGSEKMFSFDDTLTTGKLAIHDKGVKTDLSYSSFEEYMQLHIGDVTTPEIPVEEPLKVQAREFLSCIREKRKPVNDGAEALRVLNVLLACQESLTQSGKAISL